MMKFFGINYFYIYYFKTIKKGNNPLILKSITLIDPVLCVGSMGDAKTVKVANNQYHGLKSLKARIVSVMRTKRNTK